MPPSQVVRPSLWQGKVMCHTQPLLSRCSISLFGSPLGRSLAFGPSYITVAIATRSHCTPHFHRVCYVMPWQSAWWYNQVARLGLLAFIGSQSRRKTVNLHCLAGYLWEKRTSVGVNQDRKSVVEPQRWSNGSCAILLAMPAAPARPSGGYWRMGTSIFPSQACTLERSL